MRTNERVSLDPELIDRYLREGRRLRNAAIADMARSALRSVRRVFATVGTLGAAQGPVGQKG